MAHGTVRGYGSASFFFFFIFFLSFVWGSTKGWPFAPEVGTQLQNLGAGLAAKCLVRLPPSPCTLYLRQSKYRAPRTTHRTAATEISEPASSELHTYMDIDRQTDGQTDRHATRAGRNFVTATSQYMPIHYNPTPEAQYQSWGILQAALSPGC